MEFASKVQIVDAYVQYKPFRQLNVKVGQYKIPFTIENTDYAPLKFEFIDYPMALRKLMGFNEVVGGETLAATGRDMGVTLYGGFGERDGYDLVHYDFGVFNGSGINKGDENRTKDIAARLSVRPVAGLTLSGSYYWGEYGKAYLKRQRYAVGACYDRGPIVVRSEWVGGTTGIAATETTPRNDLHSDGWYAMVVGGDMDFGARGPLREFLCGQRRPFGYAPDKLYGRTGMATVRTTALPIQLYL